MVSGQSIATNDKWLWTNCPYSWPQTSADHRHLNSEKLKVKNEWLSNSIHYSLFTLHLTGAKLRYHKGQSQGKGLREVRIYTIKKYVKYLTEVSG